MRFALINSGLGLLATASELHGLRPDADLVIAMDPDGMPWGPRSPQDIAERSLAIARAVAEYEPDVIIMACNTGSVHALEVLRSEFEPDIPIVGTVPAIKPAAAAARSVAIWATVATTQSAYQRRLIAEFGGHADVTPVACPGLATAIDAGDREAINAAISDAAGRTPERCGALVLGCTEYELAADQISAAVPGAILFGSATAVASQALRRAAERLAALAKPSRPGAALDGATLARPSRPGAALDGATLARPSRPGAALDGATLAGPSRGVTTPDGATLAGTAVDGSATHGTATDGQNTRASTLTVLLSGRLASLPPAALLYRPGRELAKLDVGRDPTSGLTV